MIAKIKRLRTFVAGHFRAIELAAEEATVLVARAPYDATNRMTEFENRRNR